ncbi:peptidoglycan-binding domain-containing protein [Streptomyces bluensis]|uniref:peptidoglycan-binding domain-containing protein n=1 Tax=Streptomyces bluensis TaxID=33897 RepID=UPI0033272FA9
METSDSSRAARQPRRRRVVIGAVALAVVMAGALTVTAWHNRGGKPDTKSGGDARVATAVVARTDLSNDQTLDGTLGYGRATTVKGGRAGLITWLPATGTTVRRGEPLYRVDNVPVPVFYGSTPLYRTLEARGTTGPDVKVVADNLRKLGYDIGAQPTVGTWIAQEPVTPGEPGTGRTAGGAAQGTAGSATQTAPPDTTGTTTSTPPDTTGTATSTPPDTTGTRTSTPSGSTPSTRAPVQVKRGDGVLTSSLVAAIKRWQQSAGMPPTGVLGVGDLSVLSGAVRVESVQAQLADAADGTVLTVTSTVKSVTVPVEAGEAGSMKRGDSVAVSLPDDSTTQGTIIAIGNTVQRSDSEGGSGPGQPQLTVGIALRDTAAVRKLDSAPVRVRFTSETRKDVLSVPVGALLALREGGYAVQLPGGRLVAVKTGMFSKGLVEISGSGIEAGTKVVTTS